jgi:hypothetical protein
MPDIHIALAPCFQRRGRSTARTLQYRSGKIHEQLSGTLKVSEEGEIWCGPGPLSTDNTELTQSPNCAYTRLLQCMRHSPATTLPFSLDATSNALKRS